MRHQISVGKEVTLSSALGNIKRIVASVHGDILLVCRTEEYEAARLEDREPVCAGFRVSDVRKLGA